MRDSNYADVDMACFEITNWLISMGWTAYLAATLIKIITTMCYTKLKNRLVVPTYIKTTGVAPYS